jgi:hypothetical protein
MDVSVAAVVLTATAVISAITAIVLASTGLATSGLTAVGGGVALATIQAAIAAIARVRLIGTG